MNITNEIIKSNKNLFFSKKELLEFLKQFPDIKNDKKLYNEINKLINNLTLNKCDHIKLDENCDIISKLNQMRNIYNYTKLIENAILYSIIHQDISMKFRLELFYKKICEKQTESYNFNILNDIDEIDELMNYIKENNISTEYFDKNKQHIKSLRNNTNR